MSARILNDPFAAVDQMMAGVRVVHDRDVLMSPNGRSVVARSAAAQRRVKVVSGGGSGHEPSFWGLVGPRSLDGVAVGNVFAAPAASDVVAAVRLLGDSSGILFLYGNYQGDRLNFGIAAKRLAAEGLPTKQVLITDDVASAPPGRAGDRRGVAGSLWAFRLATAAATAGYDLARVSGIAADVVSRTRSVGVALRGCRLPTADEASFTVDANTIELGMGVHGEPGLATIDAEPAQALARRLVALLLTDGTHSNLEAAREAHTTPQPSGSPLLLINLAGATPMLEGYILANEIIACLDGSGIRPSQTLVGPYLTTLDMAGAAVSLLWPTDEMHALLAEPGQCLAGLRLP